MKEYQFPPQLGQTHVYFGYMLWEWFVIVVCGVLSTYGTILTLNPILLLPIIIFSFLVFKPTGKSSILDFFVRAYNYLLSKPITYEYREEQLDE